MPPVAGSPGDAVRERGWGEQEGSACGPFKQIQRLGLFCYSSFYSAPRSAAAGERKRARMRPAVSSRPARPTPPPRRERFQCASRWVLKPTFLQTTSYPLSSTPRSPPFLSVPWAQHIPLELVGHARVLLQLFATFETPAPWLWHFKAISNRSTLGRFTHAPSRSHSRTHARTHAGLSCLSALGQWLAMLSVTQPSLSTVPTPPRHISLCYSCADREASVCSASALCPRGFESWSGAGQCLCGGGGGGAWVPHLGSL